MGDKVDMGRIDVMAVVQKVVERSPAGAFLQPVDAAIAAIVGQDDGKGDAHHHRRGKFRVRHHIAAITHHADDIRIGPRHFDAHGPGNLVAHAAKAVFHVIATSCRAPQDMQRAGHGACGAHYDRVSARVALHRADNLGIGRQARAVGGGHQRIGGLEPLIAGSKIGVGKAVIAKRGADLFQRHFGIGDKALRAAFGRVIAVDVD